jgi:NADH:ubiquinone oxidoreductase subunit E
MAVNLLASVLEEIPGNREDLIPILQMVQDIEGFLSPESIRVISRRIRISENEIYGVATFYAQFRFHPPGEHHIQVCMGTACHVKGGAQLLVSLEYRLGIKSSETTPDKKFDLTHVACLGCCALAPVVKIDDTVYSQMSVLKLRKVLDEYDEHDES